MTQYNYFLGVDPGKSGSIAVIDKTGKILLHEQTPTLKSPKKPYIDYDINAMARLIRLAQQIGDFKCIMEDVFTLPNQGHLRGRGIGEGRMSWVAVLRISLQDQYKEIVEVVHPATWTKQMLKGSAYKGKERNINCAKDIFPDWQPKTNRQLENCDSLLLAQYGRAKQTFPFAIK